jgi:hypothetical protein
MGGYELVLYNVHVLCPSLSLVFILCLLSFVPCLSAGYNVRYLTALEELKK